MTRIISIIIAGLIVSCSHQKKESVTEFRQVTTQIIEKNETLVKVEQKEWLLQNSIERKFSNSTAKDRFVISIVGKTILEGEMILQIFNSDGKELLNEKHPSSHLIGYGLDQNAPITDKENYIKKRVNEFFNDEYFSEPAISIEEQYDMDYSDEIIWTDIKSDTTTVGFYYLIGEERGCRIAYSKKKNEVVTFFCCC